MTADPTTGPTRVRTATAPDVAPSRRPVSVRVGWFAVGLVVLAAAGVASVAFGARAVGLGDIVAGVTGTSETVSEAAVAARVPRTVLAMIVGAALGLSGGALQAVTRNPLADPAILGVMPGASLTVVTGIAFFGLSSPTGYIWVAILGAAVAATFVWFVGSLGRGGATPLKLALAGAATSAALTSLVSAVLLPRIDVMEEFRFWQVGGVGGATFAKIGQVAPFLVVAAVICLLSARGMNSLALGDDVAAGLGERVGRIRLVAGGAAVALAGAATAVAGPIAFIGLAVPHACRLLVGVDHRWLLPATALTGAIVLTLADVAGRLVARPEEVEVGVLTAILGAPIFIWIVRRTKVRAL